MQQVTVYSKNNERFAQRVANQLGLPCCIGPDWPGAEYTHVLQVDADGLAGLSLALNQAQAPGATRVDFLDPTLQYRLRTSGKRQGLGKAVGLDKAAAIQVLDATAGLGRDAFILAALGCEVLLLERAPLVHALLADGLRRAAEADSSCASAARMRLLCRDAREHCEAIQAGQAQRPQVIYLDPMFPPRSKQASVKKDMALLQGLLGPEADRTGLLAAARASASHRVVVKQPGNKTRLTGALAPSFIIGGKTAHYAVYVNSSFSSMPR